MPLRDDLLNPIPGENPAGADLRYAPIYDKLKEARRQDEDLKQGVWQTERKMADWPLVLKLGQEVIGTQSKDLQVAAWLTEALLNREGFDGLGQGLRLCQGLIENFWDYVYPVIEDEDLEFRATPLEWIGSKLESAARSQPINKAGHDYFQYKESRLMPTEEEAAANTQKGESRASMLKAGKTPPEEFDKAFGETNKAFYKAADASLTKVLADLKSLDAACQEKFGDATPSFSKLKTALDEFQHTVRILLKQKLEIDPDPIEEAPVEEAAAEGGEAGAAGDGAAGGASSPRVNAFASLPSFSDTEPADRREAVKAVVDAAEFLRRKEPGSPAPYLMLRGLRWGELRAAIAANDPRWLEAPPTEARQLLKGLAIQQKWPELLEAGERVMALGASRAWLDLQRLVVEACVALGGPHELIASAIRSELRTLLRDVPQLLDATLLDDSPAANPETRAWLNELLAEPESAAAETTPGLANPVAQPREPGWKRSYVDSYELAQQAVKANQAPKAFEIMHAEVTRQLTGRGRFFRRIQLVELAGSLGKEALVQPLMDELTAQIDANKLEDWEDPKLMAGALSTLTRWNPNIRDYPAEKAKYLARIARLDPARAFAM